ncbi:MAG: putative DNA-binding domain-containing protein [Saprospiraceae bacterium]
MAEENKMTLDKIQSWMQGTLLNPYSTSKENIESLIRPSERMEAHQHLAIYQRSYVARLRECMTKQFPALQHALGKELFQGFVDQYLQTYPSESYNLIELGKRFPQFLEETRPDKDAEEKEDWPDFLIELAIFEYNIQIIFDKKNEEKYTVASEALPEESLRLVPVFYLFKFRFPINYYYQSFQKGEAPELPFEKTTWCTIYRNNYRISFQGLTAWQYRFLGLFKENKNLSHSLEKIAEESELPLAEVRKNWLVWKKKWIGSGMLCS